MIQSKCSYHPFSVYSSLFLFLRLFPLLLHYVYRNMYRKQMVKNVKWKQKEKLGISVSCNEEEFMCIVYKLMHLYSFDCMHKILIPTHTYNIHKLMKTFIHTYIHIINHSCTRIHIKIVPSLFQVILELILKELPSSILTLIFSIQISRWYWGIQRRI